MCDITFFVSSLTQTKKMGQRIFTIIGVLCLLISCQPEKIWDVEYEITQVDQDSLQLLKVKMTLPADSSGQAILTYQDRTWGEENLHNTVHYANLLGVKGEVSMDKETGQVILQYPKNLEKIEFEYALKQDFDHPINTSVTYRPIILPEYFHVFSHNLFMLPEVDVPTLDIRLLWKGFDAPQVVHNSFGSNSSIQEIVAIAPEEFHSAIFLGGDFDIQEITIQDNKVFLTTRGDWIPFTPEEMKTLLEKTITVQRDFWNDHSQPYFTVTMQPFEQELGSSCQGTGLTNSFATSFSNNNYIDMEQMVHLFNHELLHNWIGHRIQNDNEELEYWFSEGFTEYYTYKNVAKHRINGLGAAFFISSMNDMIKNLEALSIKEVPNSEVNYNNFWTNPEYQKLPYFRGALYAFYLDYTIQKTSQGKYSLDDFMLELLAAADEGNKFNRELFLEDMTHYLPDADQIGYARFIENGNPIPFQDFFEAQGLAYENNTILYELGFAFNKDQTEVVRVVSGSAAEKAGVQRGDLVLSRSIWYGNPEKEVQLTLSRNGEEHQILYYPRRKAEIAILKNNQENQQQLKL